MNLKMHHKKSKVALSSVVQEKESLICLTPSLEYLEAFVQRGLKIQVLFKNQT